MDTPLTYQQKMNTLVITVIAMLYGFFFSKLVDRRLNYSQTAESCRHTQIFTPTGQIDPEHQQCIENRNARLKQLDDQKLKQMMIIGAAGLLIGSWVVQHQPSHGRLRNVAVGVGFGGMLTIFYYVIRHWFNFNQDMQIAILGGVLLGMGYTSYQLTS